MGNIITKKIKKVLEEYTYNFKSNQISLQLFSGKFQIDNLILNEKKINSKLEERNVPFRLEFGVLKKFLLNVSIIGQKLEKLEVDQMVLLIRGARPTYRKYSKEE